MQDASDPMRDLDVSYSYRVRRGARFAVWRNRIGVTGSLFATAMGLSYLLGRSRP